MDGVGVENQRPGRMARQNVMRCPRQAEVLTSFRANCQRSEQGLERRFSNGARKDCLRDLGGIGVFCSEDKIASWCGSGEDRVTRVAGALESSIHAALQWT